MNKQVLCFGEVLWDAFAAGKVAGGAPMNVALHLKQQGLPALMASRLGQDESGKELRAFLQANDLDSALIQTDEILPTCEVTVQLDEQQQATYEIPSPVSWDNIQAEESLLEAASKSDILVFGSLVCRHQRSRETLMELLKYDLLKIFDVNIRPPHFNMDHLKVLGGMSDILKMNADELDMLAGTELAHLSQSEKISFLADYMGCTTVCITRGNRGAIALLNGRFYEHPGYTVDVIDTVGAGDAFLATFIAGYLANESPEKMLEKACLIGAFVAGSRGANPSYDQEKISKIMRQVV